MPRQAGGERASAAPQRRRLRQEIRQAAASCAFTLWLQPRYSLADGSLRGAESQLRWPHRGSIGTQAAFMPLVEECGLADLVAAWAMTSCCRAAQSWCGGHSIALPVHGWALEESRLLAHVAGALAESGLAAERLELALTETALAQGGDEALLTLCALRDQGVGLMLDEFGGASANLLTLKTLPLTMLKLDRSLVRDVPHDKAAAAVAAAAIHLAHALGVSVVASGVETPEQRDFLMDAGCDEAQGALFGRLVVAESFPALLRGG